MPRPVAVVIFPPARAMGCVEAFRRAHDALSGRIAAHITLVFPTVHDHPDARRRLADALSGAQAFTVLLRGAGRYRDHTVYLHVASGGTAVAALHRTLSLRLGGAPASKVPAYRPHLTVARAADPASARRLTRAAATLRPIEFRARAVSLVEETRSGRWRPIARFGLRPPATTGRALARSARTTAR